MGLGCRAIKSDVGNDERKRERGRPIETSLLPLAGRSSRRVEGGRRPDEGRRYESLRFCLDQTARRGFGFASMPDRMRAGSSKRVSSIMAAMMKTLCDASA
jgi:hypothetical protein